MSWTYYSKPGNMDVGFGKIVELAEKQYQEALKEEM